MLNQILTDRFLSKLKAENDCRIFTGRHSPAGHGRFDIGKGRVAMAHRLAYQIFYGETVPDGLVVGQRCGRPACCAKDHLELITQGEANRRGFVGQNSVQASLEKTHCIHGHDYSDAYYRKNGKRQCRTCHLERCRRDRERRRAG